MEEKAQQWLAEGIAKAKAGQREEARELLLRVVERDERDALAWLWLSGVVDSDDDRRVALENVLEIEPENAAARAGLDWLDQQTLVQASPTEVGSFRDESPAAPPIHDSAPEVEPVTEPDGCPYCGRPVAESDERCPDCAQPLTIRALKQPDFPGRLTLLMVLWLVQAATDLVDGVLIVVALTAVAGGTWSALSVKYVLTYMAGTAFASGAPMAELLQTVTVFIVLDVVLVAWSLVVTAILPWRRPGAVAVALFVAALHVLLAASGFVIGVTSLVVMLVRLALALFVGFFLLEVQGDFVWVSVRQRLELDHGAKSSMDYYSRGRYYRRIGQTAKATLHLERAVLLAPEKLAFRVALGNACYALGQFERAAEQIRAALKLSPDATDLQQFLDIIVARQSSGNSRVV
jgi:Tetratricopeptide repeat